MTIHRMFAIHSPDSGAINATKWLCTLLSQLLQFLNQIDGVSVLNIWFGNLKIIWKSILMFPFYSFRFSNVPLFISISANVCWMIRFFFFQLANENILTWITQKQIFHSLTYKFYNGILVFENWNSRKVFDIVITYCT